MKLTRQMLLMVSIALMAMVSTSAARRKMDQRLSPAQWFVGVKEKRPSFSSFFDDEEVQKRHGYSSFFNEDPVDGDSLEENTKSKRKIEDLEESDDDTDDMEKRKWWNWLSKRVPPAMRGSAFREIAKRPFPTSRNGKSKTVFRGKRAFGRQFPTHKDFRGALWSEKANRYIVPFSWDQVEKRWYAAGDQPTAYDETDDKSNQKRVFDDSEETEESKRAKSKPRHYY